MTLPRDDNAVYYLDRDEEILCPDCARRDGRGYPVYYLDRDDEVLLCCDCDCEIKAAYGNPEN